MSSFYRVKVTFTDGVGLGLSRDLHLQLEKDCLMISPNVRLAGFNREACISNELLANNYMARCLPIFRKRYGDIVKLEVVKVKTHQLREKDRIRIEKDSSLIQARLEQNVMAPNKTPDVTME